MRAAKEAKDVSDVDAANILTNDYDEDMLFQLMSHYATCWLALLDGCYTK